MITIIVNLDVWSTKIFVVQKGKVLLFRVLNSGWNMILRDLLIVLGITPELGISVLKEGVKGDDSKDIYIRRYGNDKFFWLRREVFDEMVIGRINEIFSNIGNCVSRFMRVRTQKHIIVFAGDYAGYIMNKKLLTSNGEFNKSNVVSVI
jgi:hypothetical protein